MSLQQTALNLVRGRSGSAAAILSNGLAAGSSLVLQLVAARSLGASGLGRFALLNAILITFNAVQTGWIGDSLTVLDRFDPPIRAALFRSLELVLVLALVVGAGGAALGRLTSASVALLFGVALALWSLEETGRRVLIARREYWTLVANDVAYAVGAIGFLGIHVALGHELTLGVLVWALVVGSTVACVVLRLQLPARERARPPRQARPDMRGLAAFASWRSAQVGVRFVSQSAMRFVIAAVASTAALGRLEAARLLLAPVQVVINGSGFVLLPSYTEAVRQGRLTAARVRRAMVLLGGLSALAGIAALVIRPWLGDVLTAGRFEVEPSAVIAWTLATIGLAVGIPAGLAVTAHRRSRRAFVVRAADAGIGLVVATVIAALGAPNWAPAGLALGAFVGAAWLLRDLAEPAPGGDEADVEPGPVGGPVA